MSKNTPIPKGWIRDEITKHELKIVHRLDKYEKQIIGRVGKQIIYRHKYDLFNFFCEAPFYHMGRMENIKLNLLK